MRIFYPGVGPAGSPELRLDQLEAIHRTIREITEPGRSKNVLIGAGMGSGKTVVSIEVILKTQPKRALIVGVRDAYSQWATTLKEQQTGPEKDKRKLHRIISTTQTGRDNLAKLVDGEDGLYYVGLEMLRAQDWETVSETHPIDPEIKALMGDDVGDFTIPTKRAKQSHTFTDMKEVELLISDEAHRHSSQTSKAIKTVRTIPALAKMALSGTFFGNKFENAWSLTTWLWGKDIIGAKGTWEAKYCVKVLVKTKDGRQVKTKRGTPVSKIMGERTPGEFVEGLPCYVFIATPIGAVPAPEIVKVELGSEQARQYGEMAYQSLAWIPSARGSKREPLVADLPITQRMRLRTAALGAMTLIPGLDENDPDKITFSPGCKSTTLDVAYDVLHRKSWVGKKVLILTHSKPFAEETARRIGQKYRVGLKTGGVSSAQWDIEKASFMRPVSETDSVQYLVAVISAVGTAMDGLQANCAKVLWLSEDDNNTNNMQGANRIWRDGVDLDEYEAVKLVQTGTVAEGVLSKNRAHKRGVLGSIEGPAS